MADDFGDKTEPPTPRRRAEARGRGQVARSQEFSAAVLLLTGLIGLDWFGGRVWDRLVTVVRAGLSVQDRPGADSVVLFGWQSAREMAASLVPLLVLLFVVAGVVMYAQVGWLLTWAPLTPSLDRLNPINGFRRIFSGPSIVQLAQNLLKLGVVILVAWLSVNQIIDRLLLAHTTDYRVIVPLAASLIYHVGLRVAVALLVLALLDYVYQRYRHEKQLKMTKHEVKEEMKRMEGDPVIKRRRREVQLRLAAERLRAAVPKADVVVTNPTHYAVALLYDSAAMTAPTVVAKGVDYLAQRIRELATEFGIPVVEKPSLARMLYDDVAVGREIPERLYRAVAEIFAYVYEIANRRGQPRPAPLEPSRS